MIAIALPVAARADSGQVSVNDGNGWTGGSTSALFTTPQIDPGWHDARSILVRNDTRRSSSLAVGTADLVDYENGCDKAELSVDSSCGDNQGELGHELQFSIYADPENDGTFEARPRWTGTLYEIEQQPALLTNEFPASSVWGVRVAASLPLASGNETQTDEVDFNLQFDIEGAGVAGAAQVKGVKFTRHPHHGITGAISNALPFTGTPALRLVAGALWLLVGGAALLLLEHSRRRSRLAD